MTMGGYDTYAYVLGSNAHVIVATVGTAGDEMGGALRKVADAASQAYCSPFRACDEDLGASPAFLAAVNAAFDEHLPS
jgi:hypothetical protein